jgi:hypothetical protein
MKKNANGPQVAPGVADTEHEWKRTGHNPGLLRSVASVTKVGQAAADNSYEPCDR